ncbi:diadenosine tetraphosphatase [Gemmata sp. SH-PL17]|uniref:metallophosphoesterase n=1 Tax=Gemmata sp. SH-PL17 TaxID=1630693 RepID=UPI00078BBCCB|nr:metallophosphoesterase [Gemmata sp. SH-PL17]AMV24379.1 diadenosine tetraphosphatase [Gemmata sp. SH-PL17]
MQLPARVDYPVIAIGDLHGRVEWLDKLVAKLRTRTEWPTAKLVFLGDLVDRHPTVKDLVARVIELITEKPGSTCVMGNHDLALVKATGLDGPPSESWVRRYATNYDHNWTFRSYLGRTADYMPPGKWEQELAELKAAMPEEHRAFLANLPWVAEAEGHIFLHNGLSPELDCPAPVQLACAHNKIWDRAVVNPRFGTDTDRMFNPEYPVWLGADKRLSERPLPLPGKVQVSGHIKLDAPDANRVRIRIDTSGGVREPLTACVLTGPGAEPVFVFSNE